MPRSPESVLIYRDQLLPGSETFIVAQGEAMPCTTYYAGMRREHSALALPPDRTATVGGSGLLGRLQEAYAQYVSLPSAFCNQLRAWDPDLVHVHFGPDAVNGLRVARMLDVPIVVTYHGYDVTVKDEYARQSFRRHRYYLEHREKIKRDVDGFIAVSDFIVDELKASGFPEDRIYQHYIGIDLDKFQPDPTVQREPILLFVGRMVEKKGATYFLRAAARVQNEHPEMRAVLLGDGPLADDLKAEAEALGCRAEFKGMVSPEAVSDWLNRSRVFCVPSLIAESGDAEAFGMVFAEAQAMGVPVVSFASGGIPEVVKDGETGFLLPERDWEGLADRIALLMADDERWSAMRNAGKEHVRTHFDIRKQSQKICDVYRHVCQADAPS